MKLHATTAPTALRAGIFTIAPAATWATDYGHAIAHVTKGEARGYWVRDTTDRWSRHQHLAQVEEDLTWLIAHNR